MKFSIAQKVGLLTSMLFAAQVSFAAVGPMAGSKSKAKLGSQLPEGEKAIYLRVVEAYREGNVAQVYKFRDLLLKHYPRSVYADNALYLTGLLDYHKGRTAEAIQNFGDVTTRYPQSNKRVSAMYAKAVAYSKLNMPEFTKRLLKEIIDQYPGSPESQRAWIDLRLKDKRG